MQRPYVEGDVLEPAFAQHIVRVIVRVDQPGNEQLAAAVDHLRAGPFGGGRCGDGGLGVGKLVRCAHRGDAVAFDDHIPHRRAVYVEGAVVDPGPLDQRQIAAGVFRILRHDAGAAFLVGLD